MQVRMRREDLDRAKGLGILLVVFGHIVARQPPLDNEWYVVLKNAVYLFHMPFFMYLSGYVTFMSGAARLPAQQWPGLIRKRAYRLLLPFFLFGLAIVAGKMLLASYLYIDNLPSSGAAALQDLFWDTDNSPATSVWYVTVLFVLCVITPPLLKLFHGRAHLLLGYAFLLYFAPVPHVMYLDRVATYYVFFLLGGIAAEAGEHWTAAMDRSAGWWLAAWLACVTLALLTDLPRVLTFMLCGALSMPALHGLVRLPAMKHARLLLAAGTFSFVIYLLNTPCIGLTKALLLKVAPWDGLNFLMYAPLLLAAGVLGPVLIKQLMLRRVPVLDRITE